VFYDFTLTVPANTDYTTPIERRMRLTKGVIHRVEVDFPVGTRALVHVQIFRGGHQIFPTNPDGDMKTDGQVIAWDEHEELDDEPLELVAKGWSTANTYDYDIAIRIGLLSKEVIYPFTGLFGTLRKVLAFLGGK